ncbi:ABC-2 type transport system permease protein/oleandomycin transport system permease protein [Micromonospora sp. Llam0]|uniref:ABC transporter permease n=1 Tax=Micromonospora sp. Llam0 TaxID=2485143 RepID=UPI000F4A2526|nr:ABC transporter permease [Micromonospora sp. Llam0]ROO51402.1 ABC-2 type transport system permease protein/oleandomycin transport system permease protein [Micromonospora sp. Llam0]
MSPVRSRSADSGVTVRRYVTLPHAIENIGTIARRNLLSFWRNRQLLALSLIQPLTNMVLFAYVLDQVATVSGMPYRQYVIPGVLTQAVMVQAMRTGVAVSHDADAGINDRFRTLPIARSAVLLGRTLGDTAKSAIQITILMIVAVTVIGFRFETGFLRGVAATAVIALWALAVTSFSTWVGLAVRDGETAQTWLITPTLPLVFGSSGFAPIASMPDWLASFARVNPVSAVVDTARALTHGGPLLPSFLQYLAWTVGLTVVFTALAVRRFTRDK